MDKVIISKNHGELADKASSHYEACQVAGYTGSSVFLITKHGEHEFSRKTGEWIAGPYLNYKDYRILDESLDQAQQGDGYTWTLRAVDYAAVRDPGELALEDLVQAPNS